MKPGLLCRHQKNSWVVSIFEDGSIEVESLFVRRVNSAHLLSETDNIETMRLPAYVKGMMWEARQLYYDTVC